MSESKHTPGPWGHQHGSQYDSQVFAAPYLVARVYSVDNGHILPNRANATLIAAAPEMLEALRKIATGSLSCPDSAMTSKAALSDWMWTASQQCARAALAKADGKMTP